MGKHANRPAQDDNLYTAHQRGYRDGRHAVTAVVARALLESGTADLPDDAVATLREWAGQAPASSLERDQQVGRERRRGEHL